MSSQVSQSAEDKNTAPATKSPCDTKVIVGMSGGVDSSVSAHLLIEQGYQVEGLFMKNWEEDDTDDYCSAAEDMADAKSVADKLQYFTLNDIHG